MVKYWHELSIEAVESLCLEVFNPWEGRTPRNQTKFWSWPYFEQEIGPGDLQRSLLTWFLLWSYDSWVSFLSTVEWKLSPLPFATTYLGPNRSWWVTAESMMLSRSRLKQTYEMSDFFHFIILQSCCCANTPWVTLQLRCWCFTNAKKARMIFSKMSGKFWKSPNQTLLKYKCFEETAWQCCSRSSAGIWQGSFTTYLPGRFPASSFSQACLQGPALGSPGLTRCLPAGLCAIGTDLLWSWTPSAFVGYFTLGLKILNIWQNTVIFSCPISW